MRFPARVCRRCNRSRRSLETLRRTCSGFCVSKRTTLDRINQTNPQTLPGRCFKRAPPMLVDATSAPSNIGTLPGERNHFPAMPSVNIGGARTAQLLNFGGAHAAQLFPNRLVNSDEAWPNKICSLRCSCSWRPHTEVVFLFARVVALAKFW